MDPLFISVDKLHRPVYQNIEGSNHMSKCQVTLQDQEQWMQFHKLQTEMIITKSGRRMYPSINIQIKDLEPGGRYSIALDMVPANRCRHKYTISGGWTPAGAEEAQSSFRRYIHPESSATGEFWMSQPVSFGRVKLTNTPSPPVGHIVLSSMHKYQPRIIIAKTVDPGCIDWSPRSFVEFEETAFIAVTAYQNDNMTKLKIDNNPFAKGFRETGESKSKRKRILDEETEEETPIVSPASTLSDVQTCRVHSIASILSEPMSETYRPTNLATITPSGLPPTQSHTTVGPSYSGYSSPYPYSHLWPTLPAAPNPELFLSSNQPYHLVPECRDYNYPLYHPLHYRNTIKYFKNCEIKDQLSMLNWRIVTNDYSKCLPRFFCPPEHTPKDLETEGQVQEKRTFTNYSIRAIIGCD